MQLQDLAHTSREVSATRSRLKKRAALSACLGRAGPAEAALVVSYLSGVLPQGRIGLGPAILRDLPGGSAAETSLSLAEINRTFDEIAGILSLIHISEPTRPTT